MNTQQYGRRERHTTIPTTTQVEYWDLIVGSVQGRSKRHWTHTTTPTAAQVETVAIHIYH